MPPYAVKEVFPSKPDGISCRYFMPPREQTDNTQVLIVAFEGDYPDGSLGNAHGRYIASETMHGLHAFSPNCIVLDLRRLAYRWGDSLLRVFQDVALFKDAGAVAGEPAFPVIVVTSALCRDAFLSLVTPTGAAPPAWHFQDMDEAIAYAVKAANEWLNF